MKATKRGRPAGEPTENARLTPGQVEKLKAIAEAWGSEWTVRAVLEKLAGKSIDRAHERVVGPKHELGGAG